MPQAYAENLQGLLIDMVLHQKYYHLIHFGFAQKTKKLLARMKLELNMSSYFFGFMVGYDYNKQQLGYICN